VTGSWRLAVARGYVRSAGRFAPRRVGRQAFVRPTVTLPIDGLGHHRIARDPTVIAAAIDSLASPARSGVRR